MASVLIAGCGDVGCQLGLNLADKHTIYAIRRNIEVIPEPIIAIQSDLTHRFDLDIDNIDYVFYMASAGKYKDSAYYNAYVLGLKNLIHSLQGKNVKRLFFISSTSVFAQSDGEMVNENSLAEAHSFSTKRILEGEELALAGEIPSTIVRFGGIYGPEKTHLIDLVREGKAHCMEDVWSNRIHSDDCAGILAHLMNLDLAGETLETMYLGVDSQPTLSCEVYEWLAEQLNVADIEHLEPTENSRLMRSNKKLSNARILASGYQFKFPTYQDGYSHILENEDYEG